MVRPPFRRLLPSTRLPHPDYIARMLERLEMPDVFYAHSPWAHLDLIDKGVQHRRTRAESIAEQSAVITTGDIKQF